VRAQKDHENRHIEVEEYKQDILRKQRLGRGHWVEGRASDSESAVCVFPTPLLLQLVLMAGGFLGWRGGEYVYQGQ
jgi:hypothetical protein